MNIVKINQMNKIKMNLYKINLNNKIWAMVNIKRN
jgi:hypothetical protein